MRQSPIALVVLDTVRYQATSLDDPARMTTPFLERLAEQMVSYDQARATSPWTLPSHASLFTGLYASEHGVSNVNPYLPESFPTLAELLGRSGYRTAAVSANSWVGPDFGLHRGFDRFVRGWQLFDSDVDFAGKARLLSVNRADRIRKALAGHRARQWPTMLGNLGYVAYRSRGHFDGPRIARLALKEAERAASDERPLFLFVNFLDAHAPYAPPARYYSKFGVTRAEARKLDARRRKEGSGDAACKFSAGALDFSESELLTFKRLYEAEIARLDDIVSKFLPSLTRLLGDDATIVVTSDHGENVGEHGLLGHQFSVHDTLLRVPLLIRYPGGEGAGERTSALVPWQDLFATLLALADVEHEQTPSSRVLPGPPGGDPRDLVYAEYPTVQPTADLLERRYPGANTRRIDRTLTTVVGNDLSKAIWGSDGGTELYATADDPWEQRPLEDDALLGSLAEQRDAVQAQLRKVDDSEREQVEIDAEIKRQLEAIGYL